MERTEGTGLALAVVGHALLFGALSLSLLVPKPLPKIDHAPVEVTLIDEAAILSTAPVPLPAPAPAPAQAAAEPAFEEVEQVSPPEPAPQPVAKPEPKPQPVRQTQPKPNLPKPAPEKPAPVKPSPPKPAQTKPAPVKAATKPVSKPSPAKPVAAPRRPGLALDPSIVGNARNERGQSPKPAATDGGIRAQKTAAQWEASFIQSVLSKIKPHWKAPTGPDAELLKTNLLIRLNRDGSVASMSIASQTGETDSNRNLKSVHAERATRAVQRAGKFTLPDELYDIWQTLGPITFDKKL